MTISIFSSGAASEAIKNYLPELVADKVASRIFSKDFTLWGKAAESESAIRLGWVDAAETSTHLVAEVSALATELRAQGLTRVVLCGMGGSSLAPEVIANTSGVELIVLDATDPTQVSSVVQSEINRTVVVVSSKSGSTVETDSQKRVFEQAFEESGIDKSSRIFIVTDPDSPMHKAALSDGYRVFLADPNVGGRYSALTAFGIVPSVLAGVNVGPILASAISAMDSLKLDEPSNPGLQLAAAIARTASETGFKDKLGIVPGTTRVVGFGDWVEQLIAESTGKSEKGILPVVLDAHSPELESKPDDLLLVEINAEADDSIYDLAVSGDLGEMLLLWEFATAAASRLIGVNPFDQPDVESAKVAARALLDGPAVSNQIGSAAGAVALSALALESELDSLEQGISDLLSRLKPDSYLAIQCYLDRNAHSEFSKLRNAFAGLTNRPVTFGWGPRFLHSTGQYHKGGPRQGVFLQIVSGDSFDLSIPGRPFGFKGLISSQANGDAKVLADHGLPVLTVSLLDVDSAFNELLEITARK